MRADPFCMSRLGTAVLAATLTSMTWGFVAVPTASAVPPAVSAEPSSLTYTVKNGDFLFGIAVKLSVRVNDLLAVNKLTITSSIHPGDRLAVPVGGVLPVESVAAIAQPVITPAPAVAPVAPTALPAPLPGSTEYLVRNGDYLVRIAANNGVTLTALLAANSLTVTSAIFPGRKLVIPPATLPLPAATPPVVQQPASVVVTPQTNNAATVATTKYVVKNGDYFVAIANANGVTLKALLAANSMTVSSAIFPGTALVVPPATLPIPAPPAAAVAATPLVGGTPSPQQTSLATMLTFLQGELGKPYLFNSAGPDSYDCSGLVVAAYRTIGISLPHQSLLLSQKGTSVDWRTVDIQAGDLIFQIGTGKTYISHVGIAISATQWIQSARTGDVVKISSIPNDDRIQAVRRIVN